MPTALGTQSGAEFLVSLGPWHFTRHYSLDPDQISDFYALYRLAFEPIRTLSVARQVLTEAEFTEQMRHERVAKYVAWTESGEPVGLTTLTNDLSTTPWVNPDYFATHYPEQWSRDAVYYLGFTIAHPSQRHLRFVDTMVMVGIQEAVERKALIAYDICSHNMKLLRFNERVTELLSEVPGAVLEPLDAQYYACTIFV